MDTVHVGRSSNLAGASPDRSWDRLYRAGGIAAVLYVVLIVVPLVLLTTAPQPPLVGGAAVLQYIAAHKAIYLIELISFVGLSLPALMVFLALFVALMHVNKSYAALGALIGIASEIIALAYGSSPPSLNVGLLSLSDRYTTATAAGQRLVFANAAESLLATSNAVNAAGILTALGILILSLAMLQGVFHKGVAYLGILTGTLGIVSETLRDVIGPAYLLYGLLLPLWFLAVGWTLYQLGAHRSTSHEMKSLAAHTSV